MKRGFPKCSLLVLVFCTISPKTACYGAIWGWQFHGFPQLLLDASESHFLRDVSSENLFFGPCPQSRDWAFPRVPSHAAIGRLVGRSVNWSLGRFPGK